MVRALLKLNAPALHDASDAVAIATFTPFRFDKSVAAHL
jgi:Holliday junction resolvasome RuvABC endonuclease subunit